MSLYFSGKRASQKDSKASHGPILELAALILMVVLIALIYSNTVSAPFILDDLPTIQDSPTIQITDLSLKSLFRAATEHYYSNRPVPCLTLALNYYFGQQNPFGYHLFNITIHILSAIVLYYLIKGTLQIYSRSSVSRDPKKYTESSSTVSDTQMHSGIFLISIFSTLIWAVHPANTQTVNYIVQRMTSLAALFYILSLLLYIRARCSAGLKDKLFFYSGFGLSAILALASKENAATLPLVLFLYEWIFFNSVSSKWLKQKLPLLAVLVVLIGIVGIFFFDGRPFEKIMAKYANRDFSMGERGLTEFRVIVYYLTLLLFPHPNRLNIDYNFPISHSLTDPITTLFSLLVLAGLFACSIICLKKMPLYAFCILWWFTNLIIESSIIGLEIIFEHRMYLPSMFIMIIPVSLLVRFLKPKKMAVLVMVFILAICSVWTYQRNGIWADDETLWMDAVSKSPQKARPNNNLGYALSNKGRYDAAIEYYQKALVLNPSFTDAYINLGAAFFEKKDFRQAIAALKKALTLKPDSVKAHINLGTIFMQMGVRADAITHFSEALNLNSSLPGVHNNLGFLLASQGDTAEAFNHYKQALEIKPDYDRAHNNLASLLLRSGQFSEAIAHYKKALLLNPKAAKAHNNLGVAHMFNQQPDQAIKHFQIAIELDPDYSKAKENLQRAMSDLSKRNISDP